MKNTNKKQRPILTVVFMMGATVISKVLGMLRTVLLAPKYGTGIEANAFSAASIIPLTFFDLLFSAAILGCFIPVYNSFKKDGNTDESEKKADEFACIFFNAILLLTSVLAVIGIVFAQPIINFMAQGDFFTEETKILAAKLLRIMFPMIIFIGGAYTAVGVMQSKGRYFIPALISAVSNGGVILYLILLDDKLGKFGIYGLCAAYLAAWLIQFLTLAIPLIHSGFKYRLLIDLKNPALISALKMAPPIMVGSWLAPITLLSGTFFASMIDVPGNVTVVNYAYNIYIIIVGILTYSICNYVFPKLSSMSVCGENEEFVRTVRTGLFSSLLIIMPFISAVTILSGEGVSILYLGGEFSPQAAEYTADTLKCIALAMPAFSVIEIFTRVFYSRNLQKIPMAASIIGIIVNLVASVLLVRVTSLGMASIGIAIALGQYAAAVTLIICASKKIRGIFTRDYVSAIIKMLAGGIVSAAAMYCIYLMTGNNPYSAGRLQNIAVAGITFIGGTAVYVMSLYLLKILPKKSKEVRNI